MGEVRRRTAAIVVAGGRGTRMGGIDKPGLELAGSTLRERALAAARDARLEPVVHVGPETDGGPVAALAAGIARLDLAVVYDVVVLAGDLVRPDLVVAALLADGLGGPGDDGAASDGSAPDGTVLVDPEGREQWLAARYRVEALLARLKALPDGPRGASLRALVDGLDLCRARTDGAVVADVDSWQDYETAKGQVDD